MTVRILLFSLTQRLYRERRTRLHFAGQEGILGSGEGHQGILPGKRGAASVRAGGGGAHRREGDQALQCQHGQLGGHSRLILYYSILSIYPNTSVGCLPQQIADPDDKAHWCHECGVEHSPWQEQEVANQVFKAVWQAATHILDYFDLTFLIFFLQPLARPAEQHRQHVDGKGDHNCSEGHCQKKREHEIEYN